MPDAHNIKFYCLIRESKCLKLSCIVLFMCIYTEATVVMYIDCQCFMWMTHGYLNVKQGNRVLISECIFTSYHLPSSGHSLSKMTQRKMLVLSSLISVVNAVDDTSCLLSMRLYLAELYLEYSITNMISYDAIGQMMIYLDQHIHLTKILLLCSQL
jgi:hypothetical protein